MILLLRLHHVLDALLFALLLVADQSKDVPAIRGIYTQHELRPDKLSILVRPLE